MALNDYLSISEDIQKKRDKQKGRDDECITCPTCDSQWFEEIMLARYSLQHQLAFGQRPPKRPSSQDYVMLKCCHCGDFLKPRVSVDLRDNASYGYNYLLDTLEGKEDKRPKKEQVKDDGKIQSEKL